MKNFVEGKKQKQGITFSTLFGVMLSQTNEFGNQWLNKLRPLLLDGGCSSRWN
jgi:hypothetical protein